MISLCFGLLIAVRTLTFPQVLVHLLPLEKVSAPHQPARKMSSDHWANGKGQIKFSDPREPLPQELQAFLRSEGQVDAQARQSGVSALRQGHTDEAIHFFENRIATAGITSLAPELADVYMIRNENERAFQLLLPYDTDNFAIGARLSALLAARGTVFPGQREYVLRGIPESDQVSPYLPSGNSAGAVCRLSLIAILLQNSDAGEADYRWRQRFYCDRILALDPGDVIANQGAADVLRSTHDYAGAVARLERALVRAQGTTRGIIQRQLAKDIWRRDHS